jgi:hypothetical protein
VNLFNENRTMHNTWSVILAMYNLPSWLCHKRKYLMLCHKRKYLMLSIDVFLESLIEDMTKIWNEGMRMWDQYQQDYFTLYEIIFVCIHDAPGGLYIIRAD